VASLLVDSPPAHAGEHEQGNSTGAPAGPGGVGGAPGPDASQTAQRNCANCAAPLAPDQDWCLQCGAGAPGSLGGAAAGWRSSAAVLGATAVLVLGAAVAAYAALTHSSPKARTLTTTVAQVAPVTPPATTTPIAPSKATSPQTVKPVLPLGAVKPPKIPLTATVPKPSATTPKIPANAPAATPTPSSTTKQPSSAGANGSTPSEPTAGQSPNESQQAAILLDTNAASTYNPYDLPAAGFGDPSLAIDGDPTTAWTAQVNPATAPKLAEGLLIDLKSPQRLSTAVVVTSTPGMTIQLYGASTSVPPTSITDSAWVTLGASIVDKKKTLRIALHHSTRAFRFVTLWISQAPPASIGTEQAPGHVSVNELELFPVA
jgi:outer membrane biosynthesis protein TonB